jgi:hypothetical protein
MRLTTVLIAAAAALACVPAALAEGPPGAAGKARAQAAKECAALKRQLGTAVFKATYPNAAKCIAERAQATKEQQAEAAAECKAKVRNAKAKQKAKAFAACVARESAADAREDRQELVDAAKACARERAAGAAAFAARYGTGPTKANAFGKCVSAAAQAADEAEEAEDAEEADEPAEEEGSEDADEDEDDGDA